MSDTLYSSWHRRQAFAYNRLAADRPRCKHDGYLLDKAGRCWFCRKVNRQVARAAKAGQR